MTILWSNNASTTVSGSITAVSTTVTLAAGTGVLFPNPTGGDFYCATFYDQATKTINEIIHVTAMAGDVATIVRAQEGTTARAWNAGDIFANLVTAGTLRAFVQTTGGPAVNTSILYAGVDTSITPGLIIATTSPVPSGLGIGMVFSIKVANNNPGTTMCQFNGGASIEAVRTDGSHTVGGNFIAGQDYLFMYNGVNFTSTIPPIPQQVPQNVFYVRADSTSILNTGTGLESATGLANTTTQAFLTIQGAINTIKSRYVSQSGVTIRVADGYYTSGAADSTNYIASWSIIGNTTTPDNCTIDCRSTVGSSFVLGSQAGVCINASGSCIMSASGFKFLSYYNNAGCYGGSLTLTNNHYTNSIFGNGSVDVGPGFLSLQGTNNSYSSTGSDYCYVGTGGNGRVIMGSYDIYNSAPYAINIIGTPVITGGWVFAEGGGICTPFGNVMTYTGNTSGPEYICLYAGGIIHEYGSFPTFPHTTPGTLGFLGYAA